MSTEFLFLADLVLVLRFRLLLADGSVPGSRWAGKAVVELLALTLFSGSPALLGAAATIVLVNIAAAWSERRGGGRHGGRLVLGVAELLLLSFWFAPRWGVQFRPGFVAGLNQAAAWTALGTELQRLIGARGFRVAFGALVAANEANLFVRWLLVRLQIKPGTPSLLGTRIDANEFNRGRVIGLLERCLIYCFVLTGQYGAIGFTLAAKGFTRFKELEDRGFAEYVLVGTLLSSSVAMAVGVWAKWPGP